MRATGKSIKKYNAKAAIVIKELAIRHEVTESFVRMAIRGDRESETAEIIKKEYNRITKAIENILSK